MSQCTVCKGYGHPSASHVATCVVCGKVKPALSLDALRKECEESPYRKGYWVYDCGDEAGHAAIRDRASAIPGDPDAPKARQAKLVKGEKETLRPLW